MAPAAWAAFFASLSSRVGDGGAWVALTLKGRSCGSGVGLPPWDEVLGTRLTPLTPLSPSLPAEDGAAALQDRAG